MQLRYYVAALGFRDIAYHLYICLVLWKTLLFPLFLYTIYEVQAACHALMSSHKLALKVSYSREQMYNFDCFC